MSKWEDKTDRKNEIKERDKSRRDNLGKFFYDLAKLTFAAIVLGEMLSLQKESVDAQGWYLMGIGVLFTYLLAWIGNKIFK